MTAREHNDYEVRPELSPFAYTTIETTVTRANVTQTTVTRSTVTLQHDRHYHKFDNPTPLT